MAGGGASVSLRTWGQEAPPSPPAAPRILPRTVSFASVTGAPRAAGASWRVAECGSLGDAPCWRVAPARVKPSCVLQFSLLRSAVLCPLGAGALRPRSLSSQPPAGAPFEASPPHGSGRSRRPWGPPRALDNSAGLGSGWQLETLVVLKLSIGHF